MDIFISYSSKDIDFAKKLCAILKNKNYSYWIAHENECFGDQYAATIMSEIDKTKVVVVLASKNSCESIHVINELNAAVMRNKKLLPIIIDDTPLSPAMEYYLASHHYLYANTPDFYNHFINRLGALFNRNISEMPKNTVDNTTAEQAPVNPQSQQVPYNPQPQQVPYSPQYIPPLPQQKKKEKKWVIPLLIVLIFFAVIGAVANSAPTDNDNSSTDVETTRENISIEIENRYDISTLPTEFPEVYQYTNGEIINNTYINEWANLKFDLGDTWIDESQEPEFTGSLDADNEYGLILSDTDEQRSVCLGFERLTDEQTSITAEQYVNIVATRTSSDFEAQGIPNEYTECFITELNGEQYHSVSITLNNTTTTTQFLVRKQGDYIIWFLVYGESPDAVTEILNKFEPARKK